MRLRAGLVAASVALSIAVATPAHSGAQVGTTFPKGFPILYDHSLKVPLTGFGAKGAIKRTPVIFLHGNNDTVYPTSCNSSYGKIRDFAQYFADRGYRTSELWGLNYQGDQCDLQTDQTRRAGTPHTAKANVPDLRAFVKAVLAYTGAKQVDIVGHSLGSTMPREWMRQDRAYKLVRRFVGVDGPEHGIINCSPSPRNYYVSIGFNPDSPVCLEFGSEHTPLLHRLNSGDETPGPTQYLVIANAEKSFVYIDKQDGVLLPVPPEDREGKAHDFSRSARLRGAKLVLLTDQGKYDNTLLASHTGIINSPEAWRAAYRFLTAGGPGE